MPRLMRSLDQIMAKRKKDTLFLNFPEMMWSVRSVYGEAARAEHFEWLAVQDIEWESAAPDGWQEGDPGIYWLHIETDNPRIAAYSARYENTDGSSLRPEVYSMGIMEYGPWRERHPDALRCRPRCCSPLPGYVHAEGYPDRARTVGSVVNANIGRF